MVFLLRVSQFLSTLCTSVQCKFTVLIFFVDIFRVFVRGRFLWKICAFWLTLCLFQVWGENHTGFWWYLEFMTKCRSETAYTCVDQCTSTSCVHKQILLSVYLRKWTRTKVCSSRLIQLMSKNLYTPIPNDTCMISTYSSQFDYLRLISSY